MEIKLTDNTLHEFTINKVEQTIRDVYYQNNPNLLLNNKKWTKDDYNLFNYILDISQSINHKLNDEKFIKNNVHLFGNQEYDHNTRDNFLNIIGWNIEDFRVQTGNLIGFINKKVNKKNIQVKISSRFGNDFLLKLISYSDGFLEMPDYGSVSKTGFSEWIMIFLWKSALKKAFRLGLPKHYINKKEDLIKIRGNIDINDYIKRKGHEGKYLCQFREHDYNNPVNRLINYVFNRLGTKNNSLILDCFRMGNAFAEGTNSCLPNFSEALATPKITNPFYSDYNRVIDLSKNILRKEFGDISSEENITSAFFFDISMLFEFFIRKVLLRNGLNLLPKNDKRFRISRGLGKNSDFHLYPDIIIENGNSVDVFDVKYKNFDFEKGVNRNDLYQLHTYVGNLSNDNTVKRCGLIYPIKQSTWEAKIKERKIHNRLVIAKKEIDFYVFFFVVPDNIEPNGKSSDAYDKQINDEIQYFVDTIRGLLN